MPKSSIRPWSSPPDPKGGRVDFQAPSAFIGCRCFRRVAMSNLHGVTSSPSRCAVACGRCCRAAAVVAGVLGVISRCCAGASWRGIVDAWLREYRRKGPLASKTSRDDLPGALSATAPGIRDLSFASHNGAWRPSPRLRDRGRRRARGLTCVLRGGPVDSASPGSSAQNEESGR